MSRKPLRMASEMTAGLLSPVLHSAVARMRDSRRSEATFETKEPPWPSKTAKKLKVGSPSTPI
jgi:hypothetical protein